MQAAIVNTIVDLKNLQVSSSQDFTSQNSSPIAKDYSVSHKSEEKVSSTEQKKSFEQMVKDIQNKVNYLLLTIYLSYITFDETIDYELPLREKD